MEIRLCQSIILLGCVLGASWEGLQLHCVVCEWMLHSQTTQHATSLWTHSVLCVSAPPISWLPKTSVCVCVCVFVLLDYLACVAVESVALSAHAHTHAHNFTCNFIFHSNRFSPLPSHTHQCQSLVVQQWFWGGFQVPRGFWCWFLLLLGGHAGGSRRFYWVLGMFLGDLVVVLSSSMWFFGGSVNQPSVG